MDDRVEYTDAAQDPGNKQQRLFDRFPSRFPARFKDTRNDFGTDVYLRNASAGGVRITTKERLYLNDNVALEVDLPDGKSAMTLRGQVVWVKSKGDDIWDAGLKFHKITLMDMWRPYKFNEISETA
jgi:hypothetical protein